MDKKDLKKTYIEAAQIIRDAVSLLYANYNQFNSIALVNLPSYYENQIYEVFNRLKDVPDELKEKYKKTYKEIYKLTEHMNRFIQWVQIRICNPYHEDYFNGIVTGDPELDGGLYIDNEYIEEIKAALNKGYLHKVGEHLKIAKEAVEYYYKKLTEFVSNKEKLKSLEKQLKLLHFEIIDYIENELGTENKELKHLLKEIENAIKNLIYNYYDHGVEILSVVKRKCEKVINFQIPLPEEITLSNFSSQ